MFTYPISKRDQVASRGEELINFTLSIPANMLRTVVSRLPTVQGGFRPGKDISVRLMKFFGRIKHWTDDDWCLMAEIWSLWTRGHSEMYEALGMPNDDELERLVSELNETPERLRELIGRLVAAARRGAFDRESLQMWYELGPLIPDSITSLWILLAPSKEELASLSQLRGLQERFPLIEGQLERTLHMYKSLQSQIKNVADSGLAHENQLKALAKQLVALKDTQDQACASISKLYQQIEGIQKYQNDRLQALELQLTEYATSYDPTFDPVVLKAAQEALKQYVESIAAQVEGLQSQIAELENRVSGAAGPTMIVTHFKSSTHTCDLVDRQSVVTHLARNLGGLGLNLVEARTLATDVVIAALTGQLISFGGSLGAKVAQRCALSLAGNYVTMHIPVGLMDGSHFSHVLTRVVDDVRASGHTTALILEGINRSAIEVYGPSLRDLICNRMLGLEDQGLPLIILATLVQGPSAIPCGKEILELGPVFDTDALTWTDRVPTPAQAGMMLPQAWTMQATEDIPFDWQDIALPQKLVAAGGPLWRRAVSLACRVGSELDVRQGIDSACRVGFGWVLPMAFHLGVELDDETISRFHNDDRTHLLLRKAREVGDA